jgi:hypothetical protein
METLLKLAYYGTGGVSLLIVLFFFLANLLGPDTVGENWRHKAILGTAGSIGIGMLLWAMRLGHFQGHWVSGTLVAMAAVFVFAFVTFAGLLAFTNIHWQ